MRRVQWLAIPSAILAGVAAVACILADPPPILTFPPAPRPAILTDSVVPPNVHKLTPNASNTIEFVVPVAVDPELSLSWRVFYDLDSTFANQTTPPILQSLEGVDEDGGTFGDVDIATRLISFQIDTSDPQLVGCHQFTFIVAYGFDPNVSDKAIDPPGGDRYDWFYEPVTDCTLIEAAPPVPIEAGSDADGATE